MENVVDISELINKSTQGSAADFKMLYEHLIDKVFAYIRYRTSSEDDATDITQEIFVDLYKALPKFTFSSNEEFYGFVFKISKRKLAKFYGSKHTKISKNTSEFNEELYLDSTNNNQVLYEVNSAVNLLDEVAKDIVVLHHWSRYTFPEIAMLLNMTESAVRVRHHRAIKTLSVTLDIQK
jgi:RNA polymerase sigma-70 factor (ECF subfamily)